MIAVIFVRVGSRHNGGETKHVTSIRRDPSIIMGEQSIMTQKKAKQRLRYNPCEVNRKQRRANFVKDKLPSTTGD
jgi:hypothetical protein